MENKMIFFERIALNIGTGIIGGSITSLFQKGKLDILEMSLIILFSGLIIYVGNKKTNIETNTETNKEIEK